LQFTSVFTDSVRASFLNLWRHKRVEATALLFCVLVILLLLSLTGVPLSLKAALKVLVRVLASLLLTRVVHFNEFIESIFDSTVMLKACLIVEANLSVTVFWVQLVSGKKVFVNVAMRAGAFTL